MPARTGSSSRHGVCARLLLPAQCAAGRILAEKLHTAAAAGRASTLAGNGISAPRYAPPTALAAPGAGEATRLRARGRERRLRAGRPHRRTSGKSKMHRLRRLLPDDLRRGKGWTR
mgnify:CR=1 FL=1